MAVLFGADRREIAAAISQARSWGFSPSLSHIKLTRDGVKARIRLRLKRRSLGLGSLDTLYQRASSEEFQRAIVTFIGACREPVRLRLSQRGDRVSLTVWDAPWPLLLTETIYHDGDPWHSWSRYDCKPTRIPGVVALRPLPTVYAPLKRERQFDVRLAAWRPPAKVRVDMYDPTRVTSHWDLPTVPPNRMVGHSLNVGKPDRFLGAKSVTIWVPVDRA